MTKNGAQVVARAKTDGEFRERLLKDRKSAVAEMGFGMPEHHRHLAVLENTPDIHNLFVCAQCSCTAYTIIGAAPDWYKNLEYRARVVREACTVLREMGLGPAGHDRDPRVGYDRRLAQYGVAGAAENDASLVRRTAGRHRDAGGDDRHSTP